MAGGKRFKLTSPQIQFLTGWAGDSPSLAVSAISKANPAVATVAAGFDAVTGSVARISGALGMTEVNDVGLVLEKVDSTHFKLLDVNSTDYGAYQASSGKIDLAVFSTLCELTGFNRQGGTSPEIPATSQCSVAQEFEIGLPDFGSVQVDYNFAPGVAVQQAIQAAYEAGSVFAFKVTLPNSGGTLVCLGFVQQTSEAVQEGALWTASFTMRCTGKRYYFAAA
jgi:hypothetical protein